MDKTNIRPRISNNHNPIHPVPARKNNPSLNRRDKSSGKKNRDARMSISIFLQLIVNS